MHGGVECRKAVQQRGNAVTLTTGVDNEDHWRAEQRGDVRGRPMCDAGRVRVDAPVEKAHYPLDYGDVGSRAAVPVQGADQLVADQHRVEVSAGPACGEPVVARVDEVGPDLERCHGTA